MGEAALPTLIQALPIKVAPKNVQNGIPKWPHVIPAKSKSCTSARQSRDGKFPNALIYVLPDLELMLPRAQQKSRTFAHIRTPRSAGRHVIFWFTMRS
jgi:hypothetical protein